VHYKKKKSFCCHVHKFLRASIHPSVHLILLSPTAPGVCGCPYIGL
jgi:hypothetical protein